MRQQERLSALLRNHLRAVVGMVLMLGVGAVLVLFSPEIREHYRQLFLLQEHNTFLFSASFTALMILACMTSIFPASILGVLAGAVFGPFKGFALSAGGILGGALLAFIFSRYFFRGASCLLVNKVIDLAKFEARLAQYGWRYALLLRLAPLAPFSITSYGLGLTPISLGHYLLATLASLPFLLVCAYLGSLSGALIGSSEIDREALWRLALIFTGAAILIAITAHWLAPRGQPLPNGRAPQIWHDQPDL